MEDKLVPAPFDWKTFLQTDVKKVLPETIRKAMDLSESSSTDLVSRYHRLERDADGVPTDEEIRYHLASFKKLLNTYYHYLGFHQAGPLYGMAENERLKLTIFYRTINNKCCKLA